MSNVKDGANCVEEQLSIVVPDLGESGQGSPDKQKDISMGGVMRLDRNRIPALLLTL
jgi:hypothetical protein